MYMYVGIILAEYKTSQKYTDNQLIWFYDKLYLIIRNKKNYVNKTELHRKP